MKEFSYDKTPAFAEGAKGRPHFPKDFFWGSAASAHQVEGGNKNDWTEWERANAKSLAWRAESRYGNLPAWPRISKQAMDPANYISGRACDHYHRFREDFDIAKELGHNAHRFSIEWSRVEPEEGKFNEKEIEHYREIIRALRERGLEPFVTLWHWTLPVWFRDQGGWANKKSVEYFSRYAARIIEALPEVTFWITLNETNVYTALGYIKCVQPPARFSIFSYFLANHHLSRAHCAVYRLIKKKNKNAMIGIAHHIIFFHRSRIKSFFWNHFFIRSLGTLQDFIGVNYYRSDRSSQGMTDLGWGIDPEGLTHVLKVMARYKKPLYITENGVADARDIMRARFIREHVMAVERALEGGVDVRGYFYWSLLDNFEIPRGNGFWPRFGLVEVDYKTLERRIRPSAWEYKKIIESRDVT